MRSTPQSSLAPSSYAPSISSYTGSFASLVENVVPEVRDGRGWAMAETFRSLCLQGPRVILNHSNFFSYNDEKTMDRHVPREA